MVRRCAMLLGMTLLASGCGGEPDEQTPSRAAPIATPQPTAPPPNPLEQVPPVRKRPPNPLARRSMWPKLPPISVKPATVAPSFAGRFTGVIDGDPADLTIRVADNGLLEGRLVNEGDAYALRARVDGVHARGTLRVDATSPPMKFVATLAENNVTFDVDQAGDRMRFTLTRTAANAPPVATVQPRPQPTPLPKPTPPARPRAAGLDSRYFGRWRITIIRRSVISANTTTYVNCWLGADGRYQYGGSQSLITFRPATGTPQTGGVENSNVEMGWWKTSGNQMLYRAKPNGPWLNWGRLSGFSRGAFVLYVGRNKQLWERP